MEKRRAMLPVGGKTYPQRHLIYEHPQYQYSQNAKRLVLLYLSLFYFWRACRFFAHLVTLAS